MRERSGLIYSLSAYIIWGSFPAFFVLLSAVNAWQITSWRVLSSLLFGMLLITVTRNWPELRRVLRDRRQFWMLALAAILLWVNWQTFLIGTVTGHILETSLGYYINPFVTIALAVLFRGERLSRLQLIAVSLAALAVAQLTINYGQLPWIALILALSFGLYGFVKKQAAEDVHASVGMTVETIALVPLAMIQLAFVLFTDPQSFALTQGIGTALLLLASGPLTMIPLMLFAAGTKRLPLMYLGFIQFLTPTLGFLFGLLVMHEPMPLERWIGFIGVWLAGIVLVIDLVRRAQRNRIR